MVMFSILLVDESFAFKYATVRIFGERKMIELCLLCLPNTVIYNERVRHASHQWKVIIVFPLDVLKAERENFWEVNFQNRNMWEGLKSRVRMGDESSGSWTPDSGNTDPL